MFTILYNYLVYLVSVVEFIQSNFKGLMDMNSEVDYLDLDVESWLVDITKSFVLPTFSRRRRHFHHRSQCL